MFFFRNRCNCCCQNNYSQEDLKRDLLKLANSFDDLLKKFKEEQDKLK